MTRFISNLILLVTTTFILLAEMELYARAYCQLKYKVPFFRLTTTEMNDAVLGWKGDCIIGDTQSKKTKIFFVGDSFTKNYLNGKMYFDIVKQNIDIELFVYGGSGYGTMQEYLVINKYIDKIKPDLIVLQVCSNDFINNSWGLERKSYIHNNYLVRPYYENGRIKYHFPGEPVFLKQYIIPYSRLACLIAVRIDRKLATLVREGRLKTVEDYIETKGLDFNEFKQSADTTLELMRMIKERCGKTSIIAFSTFNDEPYFNQFKLIFNYVKINFLVDIPKLAWDAEGLRRAKNNGHWGEKGHATCGAYLAEYIKTNFLN